VATTTAQPSLLDLLPAGLTQLLKVLTSGGGTTTPTPTPAPGDGAGVRIDPEGYQANPAPSPTGHP
jgi:hypothetical protein